MLGQNRTYYAPDTNVVFPLAGCALAPMLRANNGLTASAAPAGGRAGRALVFLPLVITRIPVTEWRLWTAGMFPVELAAMVLVLGAAKISLLRLRILGRFGRISYGLYLWNDVVISLELGGRMPNGQARLIAAHAAIAIGNRPLGGVLVPGRITGSTTQMARHQPVPDVLSVDLPWIDPASLDRPQIDPAQGGLQISARLRRVRL